MRSATAKIDLCRTHSARAGGVSNVWAANREVGDEAEDEDHPWRAEWLLDRPGDREDLTGVFYLPPEHLSVPWTFLTGLLVAIGGAIAVAGVGMVAATRRPATTLLRDL
jgi:hypothetical protein